MSIPKGIWRVFAGLVVAALAMTTLTACSSSKKNLTFCTDATYVPAEYYGTVKVGTKELQKALVGSDIDIAKAVAKKVGRNARFDNITFSKTIPSLLAKKCDAIISFMNDTAARRKQVAFVDYMAAGQSVLTKKSAPPVTSVASLAGRTVAVDGGTTEADFLTAQKAAGATFTVQSYKTQSAAIVAVQTGKAQVYFGDSPTIDASVAADSSLRAGAQLVAPIPVGIAFRPGDSLIPKVKSAVAKLYENGTMGKILVKWKLTKYAITP